jgi:hypothetical protein
MTRKTDTKKYRCERSSLNTASRYAPGGEERLELSLTSRATLRLFLQCALAFFVGVNVMTLCANKVFASPPQLDAAPAFGDTLFLSKWQTVNVTVANPADGDAFQGEIQVAIEDQSTGQRLMAFGRSVALPRGVGSVRVPITIYLTDRVLNSGLHLLLIASPNQGGNLMAQRTIKSLSRWINGAALVAVTQTPDGIGAPAGTDIRLITSAQPPNSPPALPIGVTYATDPSALPDRAAGYQTAEAVWLGPDVSPGVFSDTQAEALRRYVFSGGLLLPSSVAAEKLRKDERFRPWIPPPGVAVARSIGRGTVSILNDNAIPANATDAVVFWRRFLQQQTPPQSVGRVASDNDGFGYNYFANSVLHLSGLSSPGVVGVGGFLLGYLLLIVPVNYLILKRLDRREWAWFTIPTFAALFSLGAYGFSYATKGRQVWVNIASIAEMTNGSGEALIHSAIGLYSPVRARYNVGIDAADAVVWRQDDGLMGEANISTPLFFERDSGGSVAQGVTTPMWGMAVTLAQTTSITLKDGFTIQSVRKGSEIDGTVINRTGRPLENVVIRLGSNGKRLGNLGSGQTLTFRFHTGREDRLAMETGFELEPPQEAKPSAEVMRRRVAAGISQGAFEGLGLQFSEKRLTLTGWSYEPLMPVQIDGRSVNSGENVSLIIVSRDVP